MQKYFEKNRYDFSRLIEKINNMSFDVPDILVYDIDAEVSVEIYGGDKLSKSDLIDIIKDFSIFDNLVQSESEQEFEKNHLNIEYYQFIPSWIRVKREEVVIGYWGMYVNTSFEKTFKKENGLWIMK